MSLIDPVTLGTLFTILVALFTQMEAVVHILAAGGR